jgi:release factor glutamine methyltransferase
LLAQQTIGRILKEAQAQIAATLCLPANEARLEAQILLQHALNVNRAWLLTHENDALEPYVLANFNALLQRRLHGEPIAYILGKREFYGLEFKVTTDTLIPRPDTETLIEAALEKIPLEPSFRRKPESSSIKFLDSGLRRNDEPRVLDLGTGTGAIAIAIAKHRPQAQVTAVDASPAALAVAYENAQRLLAPRLGERGWGEGKDVQVANLRLIQSDWFSTLAGQTFDLIVSNPPYIAEEDAHLAQGDLRFEPMSALASGKDGLSDIRHIISQARQHLQPQGWLMLEHGYDQSEKVAALMKNSDFSTVSSVADLSGVFRVTLGQHLP